MKNILFTYMLLLSLFLSIFPFYDKKENLNQDEGNINTQVQNENTEQYTSSMYNDLLYESDNFVVASDYINSDNIEITFINTTTYDPTNIFSINYLITDINGNNIDETTLSGNGSNFYSKIYSTNLLKPTEIYSFNLTLTLTNEVELNTTFDITIPDFKEKELKINSVTVKDETEKSKNNASILVNTSLSSAADIYYNKILFVLVDANTNKIIGKVGKTATSAPTQIGFTNLDSGRYNLYIYGIDENNEKDYLNSLLNINVGYENEDSNSPQLYSSILYSYATSPTSANVSLYTSNEYLLGDEELSYSLNGGEKILIDNLQERETIITISDLDPNKNYEITLYDNNGDELDTSTFSTKSNSIIDPFIYESENVEITDKNAKIEYEVFSPSTLTNLTYTLTNSDGLNTTNVINDEDFADGSGELILNNLKPNTNYELILSGENKYNSNNIHYKTTFKTSERGYKNPAVNISLDLNTNDLISYKISAIDLTHQIESIDFDIYGVDSSISKKPEANFLKRITIKNNITYREGTFSQQNLYGYSKLYFVVKVNYLDENENIVEMEDSNINIEKYVESAGNSFKIEIITSKSAQPYKPVEANNNFFETWMGVITIILILILILIIVIIAFGIKLSLEKNTKKQLKNK